MRRGALLLLALTLLGAPLGWVVSDRLESQNEFCIACHLDAQTPLHRAKYERFRAPAVDSLAAAHWTAESGAPEPFRCIACHGGASFPNKLRVKAVAARDGLRYVAGAFGEPESMRHPLWDEDCVQCHATYSPERADSFHALEVHNVELPHACVECHDTHSAGRSGALYYLDREIVLPVCRNCHEEF